MIIRIERKEHETAAVVRAPPIFLHFIRAEPAAFIHLTRSAPLSIELSADCVRTQYEKSGF
jgi:hypothetical protein